MGHSERGWGACAGDVWVADTVATEAAEEGATDAPGSVGVLSRVIPAAG